MCCVVHCVCVCVWGFRSSRSFESALACMSIYTQRGQKDGPPPSLRLNKETEGKRQSGCFRKASRAPREGRAGAKHTRVTSPCLARAQTLALAYLLQDFWWLSGKRCGL